MRPSSARARRSANDSRGSRFRSTGSPSAACLSHGACGPALLAYLEGVTGGGRRLLRKEVIHVSLSPYRGVSDGVDHLERRLDWGTRLKRSSLGHDNGAAAGNRGGLHCFCEKNEKKKE